MNMNINIDIDDLNHTLYVIASKLHAKEAFVKHFKEDTVIALSDYVFHDLEGTPNIRLRALKVIQSDINDMPTPRVGRVLELAKKHVRDYLKSKQKIDDIILSVAEDEQFLQNHRAQKDQEKKESRESAIFKNLKNK